MHKLVSVTALAAVTIALAGCGGNSFQGSGSSSGGTGSGGTGSGGGTTTTYSLGNGTGSSFQPGMLGLSATTLSAGGSADITATVVDKTGALYTGGAVTVTFVSTCLGSGLASITPSGVSTAGTAANSVSSSTGTLNATYTAKGCSIADIITATAVVNSQTLTASGTITSQPGTIGSVQFLSATPTTIGLKGTGIAETSTVVFLVVDSTGAPRPGATVNFTLPTVVGGVTLSPASATTGADGKAQTVVSSGTQHTSVRVTASIASPVLSTQSGVLTVTTGLPASDSFSISVGSADYGGASLVTAPPPACSNVEAASINQVRVPVTMSLADRYNNPAPDGTAITLNTNAGKVVGSCATGGKDATGAVIPPGECTVQWSSEDPRPRRSAAPPAMVDNRGLIFATAIGEESFTDANGNGFYDAGESFKDLGEPYRDDNENGTYEVNEYFLDFNHNQMRDGPSGTFQGITCTGNTSDATCSSKPLEISATHVIIMSTSAAQISVGALGQNTTANTTTGGVNLVANQPFTFYVNVQDLSGTLNTTTGLLENGNPIAAGSSITIAAAGAAMSNVSSASGIQGCSEHVGGDMYRVSGTAGASASTGTVTVTIISEATKTQTLAVIPVNVP